MPPLPVAAAHRHTVLRVPREKGHHGSLPPLRIGAGGRSETQASRSALSARGETMIYLAIMRSILVALASTFAPGCDVCAVLRRAGPLGKGIHPGENAACRGTVTQRVRNVSCLTQNQACQVGAPGGRCPRPGLSDSADILGNLQWWPLGWERVRNECSDLLSVRGCDAVGASCAFHPWSSLLADEDSLVKISCLAKRLSQARFTRAGEGKTGSTVEVNAAQGALRGKEVVSARLVLCHS